MFINLKFKFIYMENCPKVLAATFIWYINFKFLFDLSMIVIQSACSEYFLTITIVMCP